MGLSITCYQVLHPFRMPAGKLFLDDLVGEAEVLGNNFDHVDVRAADDSGPIPVQPHEGRAAGN